MRIVTANIRKPAPDEDGPNDWPHRAATCCAVLADLSAQVYCLQEAREVQLQALLRALPGYSVTGVGRHPGSQDRINAILVQQSWGRVLTAGTYGLSEHPHRIGVRGWGSGSPRHVNWVQVQSAEGSLLRIISTHFDHLSAEAREQSVALINQDATDWDDHCPQVLCGDLNAVKTSVPIKALQTGGWTDAFTLESSPVPDRGTAHGYQGRAGEGGDGPIDWIFCRGIRAQNTRIIDESRFGRYPSDHYFMVTDLVDI